MKKLGVIFGFTMLMLVSVQANSSKFSYEGENGLKSTLRFEVGETQLKTVENYQQIVNNELGGIGEEGMPNIPLYSTLYQIDPSKTYEVEYSVIQSHILQNIWIEPYQYEKADSEMIVNEDFYSSSSVYPTENLLVSDPVVMRDLYALNISVVPYKFYPKTQELEVFDEIEIYITETGQSANTEFSTKPRSRVFENLYSEMTVNFTPRDSEEFQQPAVLYICDGNTDDNLYFQQLEQWRHKRGYIVYKASTDDIGTSASSIKNYIQQAYDSFTPTPEFVALVGDVDGPNNFDIPTYFESWSGYSGEGDHPYSQLDGNDLLPEVILGRISVRSNTDLAIVVNKILQYEKATDLQQNISYYEKAALIGDPSDSGVSTIITNEYLAEVMSANGMTDIREKYSGGSWSSWMQNQLDEGVLYFNYRGYWGTSGFDSGDINSANNGFKLPFATVLTCGTGGFSETTCLSESFLKAGTSPTSPKGAIASVGTATIGTHTAFNNIIDMGIYDGIFTKNVETAGEALVYGKLAIYNTYPTNPNNKVSIFTHWNNLMGDPTTHLWTDTPLQLTVDHQESIDFGTNYLEVFVHDVNGHSIDDAVVTLLKGNDEIFISNTTGNSGYAYFDLDYYSEGEISITVTKRNCQPYEGTVDIVSPAQNVNLDNQSAILVVDGNDGMLNPGETVDLSIALTNYGTSNLSGVTATLSSLSSDIVTITDPTVSYGSFVSGQTKTETGFTFILSSSATSYDDLYFMLSIEDNASNTWYSVIPIIVYGPYLSVIDNGNVAPGQTADVYISLENLGLTSIDGISAELSYDGDLIDVIESTISWGDITPGNTVVSQNPVTIAVSGDIVKGTIISLPLHIQSTFGYDRIEYYNIQIGEVTPYDPMGPDMSGYYIYDSGDIGYDLAPVYNWIEINPSNGGSGTSLNLSDSGDGNFSNAISYVNLPFNFRYYEVEYDEITVCTNGWIAFGHSELESFRNYPIPGAGGPVAMVAAFWDDLKTTGGGNVYVDSDNERVIVEWSNMKTQNNNHTETFQLILYNNPIPPYGNGEIKLQYKTYNNTSSGNYSGYTPIHGGYCTIGTENHFSNDGLQYTFNNEYARAAMVLDDETALFITTQAPITMPIPALSYTPGLLDFQIFQGQSATEEIVISNNGESGSMLTYDVDIEYPESTSPFDNTGGGPDNAGYFWSDSDISSEIEYNWIDISTNGSQLEFSTNDQAPPAIDLGFDFPFYGQSYNQCIVNPNGWVGFGSDNTSWNNAGIPSVSAPQPAIFAFWDDLSPTNNGASGCYDDGGNVYVRSEGDKFIVWFDDVYHCSETYSGLYDFEVVIYDNGNIDINYREMQGTVTSSTIGIQNAVGSDGLQVVYNNNFVQDQLSLQFRKPSTANWLDLTSSNDLSGELEYGESTSITVEANSAELLEGLYSASINIQTNAQPLAEIPVSMTVSYAAVTIDLPFQNGWNWFSVNLENNDMGLENVLSTLGESANLIKSQTGFATYYEGFGWYGMDLIENEKMYMINMLASENLVFQGIPVDFVNTPISLSDGWNWIGYLPQLPNTLNEALYSIGDLGSLIKNQTGFATYYEGFGWYGMDSMDPGLGYMLQMSDSAQLIYGAPDGLTKIKNSEVNELHWSVDYRAFEYNMTITAQLDNISEGDVLSAFVGDEVRGVTEATYFPLSDSYTFNLMVYGETDEELTFKAFQSGREVEVNGKVTFEINGIVGNDFEPILLKTNNLPTEFGLLQNYPNPFNPSTVIGYQLKVNSDVRIDIFNINGQLVEELVQGELEAGYHSVVWNADNFASGVYFVKLQAGAFIQTHKLVLMK
ncbi:MAG: T9SS type A sorting domain-containing protein [Candidatus Marinimicrobia bacterium]|nr:T9SS type A sorting domain-containing protein [Candidatus Neomarinimicrobiota bacterium]MBL7023195.1 T9SS type A sorting domain-containing protein [Candidatus Neomarinimicrobiota bacterium]MBL7109250.1 T9SS type A sorting domain-containing protein [Candidatus Neomarinimicrobiota bacterium]